MVVKDDHWVAGVRGGAALAAAHDIPTKGDEAGRTMEGLPHPTPPSTLGGAEEVYVEGQIVRRVVVGWQRQGQPGHSLLATAG